MTKLDMLLLFLISITSSGIIRALQAASIEAFDLTPTCFCTKEHAPVCDNYGVEYSNICAFNCIQQENATIVLGCSKSCPCETTSTQNTTDSESSTSIFNIAPNVSTPDPQFCLCTKELAPVCDINGVEHSNICTFECVTGRSSSNKLACNRKCPCDKTTSEKTQETTTSSWKPEITAPEQETGTTILEDFKRSSI